MTPIATPATQPLRPGDRMDAAEFERRWDAMPDLKKAELIDGVVHMAAALRYEEHASPHALLMYWLVGYWGATPGTHVADNPTYRVDDRNDPQPDAVLRLLPGHGGRSSVDADGYLVGTPELVCEVAASSVSHDRNAKLRLYRGHGVPEYLIVCTEDRRVEWYALRGGEYELLPAQGDGTYRSEVFPGLWLDPAALFDMSPPPALATLQRGLATREHAAFAERLRQATP